LNQYSQRTVPGAVDITGTANTAATITVNNEGAARRGEFFYKELATDNSAAPAYSQINVAGARNNFGPGGEDAITQKGGMVFLPQAVESFSYDDDGNLLSDGRWVYTWDGENHLVKMEATASVPAQAKQKLEFSYDYAGRRIQKKSYTWDIVTSSYQLAATTKFVYEGWNLMAQLDANNILQRTYVWGMDDSGSLQAAGGIGGLLVVSEGGDSHQVAADGNGNVVALTKASSGTNSATYEYDPFGNSLRATGEYSTSNPFRFSTKYMDTESGHLYFGHRYYSVQTGQWISRDPLEEDGGVNLYRFVENNPISNIDPVGLSHREDIARGRLDYSCKCGWIDWGHADPDSDVAANPRKLWQGITANRGEESLTKKGYAVAYEQSFDFPIFPKTLGKADGVWRKYFVRYNLSKDEQILVALSIVKEVSEKFEKLQATIPYWPLTNSGFSEEDLVSDLIGVNRAIKNYSQNFVAAACRVVPDSIAEAIFDRTGGLKYHKTWTPNYYNDAVKGCCNSAARWPEQLLKMQDIPKGELWRDWTLKVDWIFKYSEPYTLWP
jgi:RHS repeat-associated protein